MGPLRFDCEFRYPEGFALKARFETQATITALLGKSGAGKTTILHLIAGLLRPAAGLIALGNDVLFDHARSISVPVEQRGLGVVFQEHLLFPHLTVRRNLQFAARHLVRPLVAWNRLVDILELGPLLDRTPDTLSGGQKQRAALGRALIRGPKLLLMDEPLNAQDEDLKTRILDYLRRSINEWNIPTLFVTHDREDAERLAETTIRLDG